MSARITRLERRLARLEAEVEELSSQMNDLSVYFGRCAATIRSGPKKGSLCTHPARVGDYCGIHQHLNGGIRKRLN